MVLHGWFSRVRCPHLKASPAKPYDAAANVDRKDKHAPAVSSDRKILDGTNAIRQPHHFSAAINNWGSKRADVHLGHELAHETVYVDAD